MDRELEFFQINLHKAHAPTSELGGLLRNKTRFVALIQEPVARNNKVIGLDRKKGNLIHVGGNEKPRAAIYCSRNIGIHPLYQLCTRDQAVAIIHIKKDGKDKQIVICSSYFPYEPPNAPPTPEFISVIDYCKVNKLPLISGIDTNAHHYAWGSTDINSRGDDLLEFIIATDLTIMNVGNKPTFVTKTRKEVLDISLCTQDLSTLINDWNVTEHILTSDHRCINFTVGFDPSPPIYFRNPASTNWDYFTRLVESKIRKEHNAPQNEQETDELAEHIQNTLTEAYEIAY